MPLVIRALSDNEWAIEGDADLHTAAQIAQINQGVAAPSHVTLDLSGLAFMDSSGVKELLALGRRCGRLTLVNPRPVVRRILDLVRITDTGFVSIRDDGEPAVRRPDE